MSSFVYLSQYFTINFSNKSCDPPAESQQKFVSLSLSLSYCC
ncbi:hypothetical protein OAV88_03995 [bacterium]|nr:hypothetical protein [bacterium]